MRDSKLDALAEEHVVGPGVAPAAALGFAQHSGGQWRLSVGASGHVPAGAASSDTIFDLASLTKPFVAATYARACQAGLVHARTRLGELVEESRGASTEHTPLELVLSHRAGFSAHRAFFEPLVHARPFVRDTALRAAARAVEEPARALPPAGFAPVYSDVGYLLAGVALERRAAMALDELVRTFVTQPLGLGACSARQGLRERPDFTRRVAPTEHVRFRGGTVHAKVHDENAWAFGGHALCGHAGLFGTVHDVLGFGMALLDAWHRRSAEWLNPELVHELVRERPGGSLRLGFDSKSGPDSSAGPSASERTFGHLGFTGTSFWCDPMADCVTVLLTNRVCPTRENVLIRKARPRVHDALFRACRPSNRSEPV